jgi:hypothetical protein
MSDAEKMAAAIYESAPHRTFARFAELDAKARGIWLEIARRRIANGGTLPRRQPQTPTPPEAA